MPPLPNSNEMAETRDITSNHVLDINESPLRVVNEAHKADLECLLRVEKQTLSR